MKLQREFGNSIWLTFPQIERALDVDGRWLESVLRCQELKLVLAFFLQFCHTTYICLIYLLNNTQKTKCLSSTLFFSSRKRKCQNFKSTVCSTKSIVRSGFRDEEWIVSALSRPGVTAAAAHLHVQFVDGYLLRSPRGGQIEICPSSRPVLSGPVTYRILKIQQLTSSLPSKAILDRGVFHPVLLERLQTVQNCWRQTTWSRKYEQVIHILMYKSQQSRAQFQF